MLIFIRSTRKTIDAQVPMAVARRWSQVSDGGQPTRGGAKLFSGSQANQKDYNCVSALATASIKIRGDCAQLFHACIGSVLYMLDR
jgi:hypothetical protein